MNPSVVNADEKHNPTHSASVVLEFPTPPTIKEASMPDVILNDKELSNSAYSHIIDAPLANIDIADWLFNLLSWFSLKWRRTSSR
jgi:hypothetical protein